MKPIRIAEIFGPTVQGEGAVAGRPFMFVRTAGCDMRCVWCDSMFAVDAALHHKAWRAMTAAEIGDELARLSGGARYPVTLTGGNPALQPLGDLCDLLSARGVETTLETQGTIVPDWLDRVDAITVSPKGPSSKMAFDEAGYDAFMKAANRDGDARVSVKIVIADAADLAFAAAIRARNPRNRLYLQPCNTDPEHTDAATLLNAYRWLIDETLQRGWADVTMLPQLHALVWPGERAR